MNIYCLGCSGFHFPKVNMNSPGIYPSFNPLLLSKLFVKLKTRTCPYKLLSETHLPVLPDLNTPNAVQRDLIPDHLLSDLRRNIRGVYKSLVTIPLDGAVEIRTGGIPIPVQKLIDGTEARVLDGLIGVKVQPQIALLGGDFRREISATEFSQWRWETILTISYLKWIFKIVLVVFLSVWRWLKPSMAKTGTLPWPKPRWQGFAGPAFKSGLRVPAAETTFN